MRYPKQLRPAVWTLSILMLLAIGRDILANSRPLYCKILGESYFPGLHTLVSGAGTPFNQLVLDSIRTNNLWKTFPYESAVFAPIPFSPGDFSDRPPSINVPPLTIVPMTSRTFRHWLGTDDAGRDIAAGIVGGARVALLTGLFAMAIALIIGVFLGALAGFFGDDRFLLYRSRAWILPAGALIAFLYVFVARFYVIQTSSQEAIWKNTIAPFAGILLASAGIARLLRLFPYWSARIVIPLDLIVMRVTEVFNAIPKLILILSVAAMSPGNHSIWFIIGMIGIMSWTDMAQLVRSELLRIRELEYVTAARGLGFTETRILLRHALPNAIQPVLIACAFGVSGAILIEASLSFLGIGDDGLKGISWGSLLFSARSTNLRYWWIAIPPGLMIFATIMALTNLGDVLGARKES